MILFLLKLIEDYKILNFINIVVLKKFLKVNLIIFIFLVVKEKKKYQNWQKIIDFRKKKLEEYMTAEL